MPTATAISSGSPSGTGTTRSSGAVTNSAMDPTMARHQTRVPGAWTAEDTTSPTASAPRTKGGSGSGR